MIDLIIGVDCAAQAKNVGIALAQRFTSSWRVVKTMDCRDATSPAEIIAEWIGYSNQTLLALDAPLGWPASLGDSLSKHSAGLQITEPANTLFRRETDRFIARLIGKTPLDVGADRIARTAYSALVLLAELRKRLGESVPLAWATLPKDRVAAIEVYPAATLLAYGAIIKGYKADTGLVQRKAIFRILEEHLDCSTLKMQVYESAHILDATVCILAGIDFLVGRAIQPEQIQLAWKEGWIWVRPPNKDLGYKGE
jgi:hypothetical protein